MNCINETTKCSLGITLLPTEINLIKQIGCASHSSYQSERYRPVCYPDCENEKHIRKDEREKVLDELEQWMKGRYDLPALKEKIAELRQAGEQK